MLRRFNCCGDKFNGNLKKYYVFAFHLHAFQVGFNFFFIFYGAKIIKQYGLG